MGSELCSKHECLDMRVTIEGVDDFESAKRPASPSAFNASPFRRCRRVMAEVVAISRSIKAIFFSRCRLASTASPRGLPHSAHQLS